MADAPMREIRARVMPRKMECSDSGSMTFQMICQGLAPIDWAISMTPGSISSMDDSMIRATKGAHVMVRGTMAAVVPMEEPTTRRVKGMMATMRIMKGTDRMALTMAPRML